MAGAAQGQSTSDELARRHFDSGVAYLEESDYENALKAFEKAYELSKRPEILLNIATVQERRSDLPAAVSALQAYLDVAPDGEHAETVKLRIVNLEKRVEEQNAPRPSSPAPAPPAPAPQPAVTKPPAPTPTPVPRRSEPNRLPAFISLGAGGILAGAALATGLVAKVKYDDAKTSCAPTCTDSQLSDSRALAVTSTVLTGAAALGVGLGVVLLLTSGGSSEDLAQTTPHLDLALVPDAAAASARWSF